MQFFYFCCSEFSLWYAFICLYFLLYIFTKHFYAAILISSQFTPPTCAGNDGTIELSVVGGSGQYNYYVSHQSKHQKTEKIMTVYSIMKFRDYPQEQD